MRLTLVLLTLLTASACMSRGTGDDGASAEETRLAVTDVVEEAAPLAARALGATTIRVHAEWSECMQNLSWEYAGTGAIDAPGDDVPAQLDAVKAALTDAGYTESLVTPDQVSVERDGISFTVRRPPTTKPRLWTLSFHSDCAPYSDDDQKKIEKDAGNDFPDLEP